MSKYEKIIDDRYLSISEGDHITDIYKGGEVNYRTYTPANGISKTPSSVQFVLDACNEYTGRNQDLYLNVVGSVTIRGTALCQAIQGQLGEFSSLMINKIGFRPFPLNRTITVTHSISKASEMLENYKIIDVLACCDHLDSEYLAYQNGAPDIYAQYVSGVGKESNMLGPQNASVQNVIKPRTQGITEYQCIDANTIIIYFELHEPLLTPFSILNTDDKPALFNIPNEIISLRFKNFKEMFAIQVDSATQTITGVDVEFTTFNLETSYITRKEKSEHSSVYYFNSYSCFSSSYKNLLAEGSNSTVNAQVKSKYSTICDKVFLCGRQNPDNRISPPTTTNTWSSGTDRFLTMSSCTMQFDNKSVMLSNASQWQLYQISKRNGYTQSYTNWIGGYNGDTANALYEDGYSSCGTGSILVLDMVNDIGISNYDPPLTKNMPYSHLLTFTCKLENMSNVVANGSPLNDAVLSIIGLTKKSLIKNGNVYISQPYTIDMKKATEILNQPDNMFRSLKFSNFMKLHVGGYLKKFKKVSPEYEDKTTIKVKKNK